MKIFYILLMSLISQLALAQTEFITRWDLATAGSGATQLSFGVSTVGTASYTWTEVSPGTASGLGTFTGSTVTITGLPEDAVIDLSINPTNFRQIIINNGTDRNRLVDVKQWGTTVWTSMMQAFYGCSNLQISATDLPNLNGVTSMISMFRGCTVLNGPTNIGSWNTENVTEMISLFREARAFNQPIGTWNTSRVTTMLDMFSGATLFNQPIGTQPKGIWDTGRVTSMNGMFRYAHSFNQPIETWDTGNVTDMGFMFSEAIAFNQPIGNWNTAKVTSMVNLFAGATAFNQPLGNWNTANVTNMGTMFNSTAAFNQPIGNWNTANVTNMSSMFSITTAFNQSIGSWNTAKVTNMSSMFSGAAAFNQSLSSWTLNAAVNLTNMLNNTGMDCDHYSTTLIGWSASPATPTGRSLGALGRLYGTGAASARTTLTTTKGWIITGDAASDADCSSQINFVTSWNLATPGSGDTQLAFGVFTLGIVTYSWRELSGTRANGTGKSLFYMGSC